MTACLASCGRGTAARSTDARPELPGKGALSFRCELHDVGRCDFRLRSAFCVLRFAICDLRFAICDLRFAICDLRFAICVLRFAFCVLRFAGCGLRACGLAGLRFARAGGARAARWAGACFSGVRPSEIGLNGAISLGVRLTSDRGIYYLAASCAFVCHATDAQRRGATACETSPRPPHRVSTLAGGEKHSPFLNVVLASSGHRGRDDARGHRFGGALGLTRTSDRGAGVPSRDGRARRLRRRGDDVCGYRRPSAGPVQSWRCSVLRRETMRAVTDIGH